MDQKIIIEGFQRMENNFQEIKTEIKEMQSDIREIKTELSGMKSDIKGLQENQMDFNENIDFIKNNAVSKTEFTELEKELKQFKLITHVKLDKITSTMATKNYLDEKIYELKGELITETRTDEERLERLAGILVEEKVISPTQHQFVMRRQS